MACDTAGESQESLMADAAEGFRRLLFEATAAIDSEYFLLTVAHADGGRVEQYRERVYAYELYHQLRVRWPNWPYTLGGEVDKNGHTIVRGGALDNAKPDLLVHVPGEMSNLAVVEIKPLREWVSWNEEKGFAWDVQKLIAFRGIGYEAALMLAFGEAIERAVEYGAALRRSGVPLDLVELWHHRRPGEPAMPVRW
jgi:hypothetical protein